jgi:hypothetical protein
MNNILEKIIELGECIKSNATELAEDKQDDLKSIEKYLTSFPNYFNAVINHTIQINVVGLRYEGEEYRDKISKIDHDRRDAHIRLTDSINKLNRLSSYYQGEKIFDMDKELDSNSRDDRAQAVKIVYSFCKDVFLDEHAMNNDFTYDKMEEELIDMSNERKKFSTKISLDEFSKLKIDDEER